MPNKTPYKFAVIGAGPSGIFTVDKLLSHYSFSPKDILWIDPEFKVGDFGRKWANVPSNTKVKDFIKGLEKCSSYDIPLFSKKFELFTLNPENTCYLRHVVEPLQWITDYLIKKVSPFHSYVQSIQPNREDSWELTLSNKEKIFAKNIILAHGSNPIKFSSGPNKEIPLDIALDQNKLKDHCDITDTIAIFGSSHSAILAIKNLVEINKFKQLFNFYRSSLRYAVYVDNNTILFDNTGLKGSAAEFSKHYLESYTGTQIQRIKSTEENIAQYLPTCSKVIYAIGFQPREIFISNVNLKKYDKTTGIISNGLYGLGIAFPSEATNHLGEIERNIGLLKFARHLENIFPLWVETFR